MDNRLACYIGKVGGTGSWVGEMTTRRTAVYAGVCLVLCTACHCVCYSVVVCDRRLTCPTQSKCLWSMELPEAVTTLEVMDHTSRGFKAGGWAQ